MGWHLRAAALFNPDSLCSSTDRGREAGAQADHRRRPVGAPATMHPQRIESEASGRPALLPRTRQAQEARLLVQQGVNLLHAHAVGGEVGDDGGVDVACAGG